jgi:hypothetical protein
MTLLKFSYLFYLNSVFIIFLISCAPVYVPNNINTPQFSQAGEVKIGGWYGNNDYGISASAAIDDHWALMINGLFGSQEGSPENEKNAYEHRLWEGGFGIYNTFGETGHFDIFAGYGVGYSRYEDYHKVYVNWGNNFILVKKAKGNFKRFFMQTSYSEQISPKYSFGLAMRFSDVSFGKLFLGDNVSISAGDSYLEPAFFIIMGQKILKIKTQIGASFPLRDQPNFDHQPLWISVGVDLHFGKSDAVRSNY